LESGDNNNMQTGAIILTGLFIERHNTMTKTKTTVSVVAKMKMALTWLEKNNILL